MKLKLKRPDLPAESSDSENEQNQRYQARIIQLEKETNRLEQDYKELENKLQNTLRSLEDLNWQNKNLLKEKKSLEASNKEFQIELTESRAKVAQSRDKANTLELVFTRTKEGEELIQAQFDLAQEQEKNHNLENDNKDLLKQITNLKAQLASLQTNAQQVQIVNPLAQPFNNPNQ